MKVSIIIPTYNGERFLRETIESACAQTLPPEEVIVVNDGSTDGTEELLRSLEPDLPSLRWVNQPNGGVASARNRGVALAGGDTIAFLDHDDLWRPEKLERQREHLAAAPDLGLSFVRCEGEPERDWDPDPATVVSKLMRESVLSTASAVLVRREALDRAPPFDESLRGFADDWLMWLNLAASGVRIGYLPEVLAEHRWHSGNLSANEPEYFESACEVFDRFFATDRAPIPFDGRSRSGNWWRARWHKLTAIDAAERGDRLRARRHLLTAARIRPLSVRPGWLRML